ncbi:AzlC family ABC transporter permease [Mesorhizobium sp. CU2]|uniref:AzlC family ABC transporter permease n=1 Tax=unclassified Mesorhizobium TaxID=325217 RepID=UPI00112766DE|nr:MULTISPECIES: AzlC family ABC transporter permease [unclassified Mesorhizobium]TPN81987.1 AzlC family ABC transporter permease [Mesorhizobium sp. CU3]TPO12424.1 AzlC family ABC transporter permease [Mesorhizobium sp. CU2]
MSVSEIALAEGQISQGRGGEFRRGLAASTPVLLGIIPYALVLGAQGAQKGLSVVEVPMMTGFNFAGGSEFAAIQLWTSPPHILLIAAITFLVNSRHLLMGAALAPFLAHLPKRKVFPALFLMCDESWAVGLADAQRRAAQGLRPAFSLPFYLGAALPFYLAWVVFTTCGAALGPVLGDVEKYGFAMAFPAVFLVLMRGMWKGFAAARPWLVSLVVAALTYLIVPGAWYVAAGALSGLAAACFLAGDK